MNRLNNNASPHLEIINERIKAATDLLSELDDIFQQQLGPQHPELYGDLSNRQHQLNDSYHRLQQQIACMK